MELIQQRLLGDSLGMVPKFNINGVSQFKLRTSLAGDLSPKRIEEAGSNPHFH